MTAMVFCKSVADLCGFVIYGRIQILTSERLERTRYCGFDEPHIMHATSHHIGFFEIVMKAKDKLHHLLDFGIVSTTHRLKSLRDF